MRLAPVHGRAAKGASQRQAAQPSASFFLCNVAYCPVTLEAKKSLFFFTLFFPSNTHCGGLDLPREPSLYVPNLFFTSSILELCCESGLHPRAQAGERVPVVKTWLRRSLLAFAGLASSSLPCLIGMSEKVRPFGRFGGFPFMQDALNDTIVAADRACKVRQPRRYLNYRRHSTE
jgi:hypothetical protein